MSWLSRLANVFRTGRVDRDLDEELRFHVQARVDALMREGLTRDAAEAQARRQVGNSLRLRESSREVKLLPWLESILKDTRFALRVLRKDAVVAAAAVISLALAIGACISAFSLVDALILRELPVRDPQQLVYLKQGSAAPGEVRDIRLETLFSHPAFQLFRDAGRERAEIFALSNQRVRQALLADSGGRAERLRVQWVSGDAFAILGVTSALGRMLTPADDERPGGHQVVVISHQLWERRFGRDPSVLGRWIEIQQEPFQIVGVAQRSFTGIEPGLLTDAWLPTMMYPRGNLTNGDSNWLRVWGRLRPDVQGTRDPEPLQHIVQAVFTNFRRQLATRFRTGAPSAFIQRYINTPVTVASAANGPSALRREFQRPLLILAAVVGLVLLIACSNVANLLLARSAAREREMMLRLSIGAGRARLVQQVLVESALLAAAACPLGLLFAATAAPLIVRLLAPADLPAYLELRLDARVLAFVAGVGALTTVLFGLVPARRAATVSPIGALVAGGGRQSSRGGVLRPLVVAQIAFSLMALFVAGLLLRSFDQLTRVDLGFSKTGVLLLNIDRERPAQPSAGSGTAVPPHLAVQQLIDRVRELPGVEAASLSGFPIFRGSSMYLGVRVPGRAADSCSPLALEISSGYFQTMRIGMVTGRDFTTRDAAPEQPTAVIVNETFAGRCMGEASVVGKRFDRVSLAGTLIPMEIVGIVRNTKYNNVREAAPPTVYMPLRDADSTMQVRTRMAAAPILTAPILSGPIPSGPIPSGPIALGPLASMLRVEIPRIDPSLRVTDVALQSTYVDDTLLRERMLALLSAFLAVVGLVLAAIGLYGVLSYAVVRRTREIGIRLALGAPRASVIRSVVADVALLTAIGVVTGLAGGLFLSRFVRALLFDVEPFAVTSLALPTASLLLIGLVAALLPARRATRVNPIVALRVD